eukprot:TRINITY_DN1552_c0_g1_i1.p1 TRINITY_DN1552_c0_g1~~TRINITY_DN1552_c0_g1_i1.p1  ORF type:complete len:440 (+),score=98.31 TRINITY_DN1552_c0_g1_i1:302-1621(+)
MTLNLASKKHQIEITVVVVGDREVPKSNFCHLYASGAIPHEEQGFGTKEIPLKHDSAEITFTLSEISGQEDFSSVRHLTYKRADAFLLCFTSTAKESFASTKNWLDDIKEVCPTKPVYLVDINIDKKLRAKTVDYIRTKDAQKHAKSLNCVHFLQCYLDAKDSVVSVFKPIQEHLIQEKIKQQLQSQSEKASNNNSDIELATMQKEIAALDLEKVNEQPKLLASSSNSSSSRLKRFLSPRSGDKRKKSEESKWLSPKGSNSSSSSPTTSPASPKKDEPEKRERAESVSEKPASFLLRARSATVTAAPASPSRSAKSARSSKKYEELEKIHNKMVKLGERMQGFYVEIQLELSEKFALPTKDDISGWLCLTLQKPVDERVACFSVNTFILKLLDGEEWKFISESENVYGTKIKLMTIVGFVGKNHCDSYFPPVFPVVDFS